MDGSFGPARALRAVGTARGQRRRVAHRLPPLACLPPTNFTGPAAGDFRKKKKRLADPLDISGTGRQIQSTRAFHSTGVHLISALKLSNKPGPPPRGAASCSVLGTSCGPCYMSSTQRIIAPTIGCQYFSVIPAYFYCFLACINSLSMAYLSKLFFGER